MKNYANVNPKMLRWAQERSEVTWEELIARFKKLPEWERGESEPTFRQAELFADKVQVPLAYLFLSKAPEEPLCIPDFRSCPGHKALRISPNILDTVYLCMRRQGWYEDYAESRGQPQLDYVGSATLATSCGAAAANMRAALGFELDARQAYRNAAAAMQRLVCQAEEVGILVMVSGVVENNNHRRLNPDEFRGIALSSTLAPVVFVNAADAKVMQIYTFARKLAHIWLGQSALSNLGAAPDENTCPEEVWCDRVATEFLVPLAQFEAELRQGETLQETLFRMDKIFLSGPLPLLRQLLDTGQIDRRCFEFEWARALKRRTASGGSAGSYVERVLARASHKFVKTIIERALDDEDRDTLITDAHEYLYIRKTKAFEQVAKEVGLME